MILANHGIVSSSGSSFDADALAFITAASITDNTQKTAVNTLVTDLKTYNIWTKMKAIYPFVGGTASSHKFNLKDPRDLDAAFRLVFNGGWTHSITGSKPNGTTAYADTKLNGNILTLNNAHISVYIRENKDELGVDIGAIDIVSPNNYETNIISRYNNLFYPRMQDTNNGISNQNSSLGLFISNRLTSTTINAYYNQTLKTLTSNTTSNPTRNLYLGAANSSTGGGSAVYFSSKEQAFASIGDGLSDTEASNLYTAVQLFNTNLSRQV